MPALKCYLGLRSIQIAAQGVHTSVMNELFLLYLLSNLVEVAFKHNLEYLLANLKRQESKGTESGSRFFVILAGLAKPAPACSSLPRNSCFDRTEIRQAFNIRRSRDGVFGYCEWFLKPLKDGC